MNTAKLKRFATEARNKLRQGVSNRLVILGFDEAGTPTVSPELVPGGAVWGEKPCTVAFYRGFKALEEQIRQYGVNHVVEEAAYTWFNRLMAIRILTMNGLCEPVLRYVGSTRTPLIVDEARQGHIPQMNDEDRKALMQLLDDDTKTAEQFALLISVFCHNTPLIDKCFSLGGQASLPVHSDDYTNILFPTNLLAPEGFLDSLNTTDFITEEDYKSSELLGWLYQFYISEKKDQVFAKKGKYDADDIPAATQIFTPNWIVKYMVQNTILPQLMPEDRIDREQYRYYVQTPNTKHQIQESKYQIPNTKYLDVEDIKVADLACGSGHILNECFDLLYDLYISQGYTRREAIECIFTKNLTGIDIDTRAKQLATFALMLKACQRDASLVDASLMPRILSLGGQASLPVHPDDAEINKELQEAENLLQQFDILGSIMKFDLSEKTLEWLAVKDRQGCLSSQLLAALSTHYDAIVMNPPYMPTNKIESLSAYVNKHYKEGKADMFAVFMMVCMDRLKEGGRMGMINMQSWMFLSSFESLREVFLKEYTLSSMLHLGPRTFDELSGEVVQNTAFVFENTEPTLDIKGVYFRLVDGKNCGAKENLFLSDASKFTNEQVNYYKIPGFPIGYWLSEKLLKSFEGDNLSVCGYSRRGLQPGDTNLVVKLWYEVSNQKIGLNVRSRESAIESPFKWFKFDTGGSYRKWFGNNQSVVDWENNGYVIKHLHNPITPSEHLYFKRGIVWSKISFSGPSFRFHENGVINGDASPCFFENEESDNIFNVLAFLNSKVSKHYLSLLAPTTNLKTSDVDSIPYITGGKNHIEITCENISISKADWDAHETSWDFERNPLLAVDEQTYIDNINAMIERHRQETGEELCIDPAAPQLDSLKWRYEQYKQKWESLFMKLHANEEELNRRFIEIYGLQDELTPDVPLNEITILQQGEVSLGGQASLPVHSAEKDTRRHLPHRAGNGTLQHITFRLADSLPQSVLAEYKTTKDSWLANHPQPWDEDTEKEYHSHFSHRMDEFLDNGYGACVLKQPVVANILENAIKFHDGKKYKTLAYVIMPNHVHLLVELAPESSVSAVSHSIKSFTANEINKVLGKSGKLWMEESFDREIRNEEHYNNVIQYIWKNFRSGGVRIYDITIEGETCSKDRQGCLSSQLQWNADVVIKQFISYAVGCMMGRYRLDRPGLAIAHPNETPEEVAEYEIPSSKYQTPNTKNYFWIDTDGIIPLLPEDCGFHDNAANRMATFVRQVLGEESQTENLNFIEECLGKSIEQYFMKDFWKDHKKMYQNRPIYWLFASKKGAFQVLVYVHRMNVATVERIRSRYLLPYIERLNKRIDDLQANESTLSTKQRNQLKTLRAQVDECSEYHNRLAVVAERGIVPNLDDGIPANHALYGDVVTKLK